MSKNLPARHWALKDEFLTPFDSFFDSFFQDAFPTLSSDVRKQFLEKGSYPKIDIVNLDDSVVISAAVPGLQKKDISVEIDDNRILTISGSSHQEDEYKDRYVKREIKRSKFSRSIALSDDLELESTQAECNDGILTIKIARKNIVNVGPSIKKIEVK